MSSAAAGKRITVAVIQMQMSADSADNDACAERLIRDAAATGGQLICLPELFRSRYFCQVEDPAHWDLAQSVPGPATQRLAALAAELDVVLVAPLFERRAAGIYHNSVVVLDRARGLVGTYRKMHIPDDPGYYEKFYFTPGDATAPDDGFVVVDTSAGRLGLLICWDQWFPEAARLSALAGAEILLYPTAIGWHPQERHSQGPAQRDAWRTIQRSHAIANGVWVVACNRVGFEPAPAGAQMSGIQFWGSSFVTAPDGSVVARAGDADAEVLLARIDLSASETQRRGWPFLRDRRVDAYAGLLRRYRDTAVPGNS